ncbi:sulfate adenylyltransferase subunit 1 [Polynucleobacter sphagniphilus]|jgi:sulfate adenylyltransferase subunit 1|uniref:sulfate adenylyltransferase n=1 Tax=Polynucleobacter sphagniphilus TaxID=1743169 RepID=A0AA43S4B7_9BURK|nr:GTP-binding protein [Polynucleobacter sphagniphilus]MDF9787401.1 sulfate adenylyltransferase subunit 1 [Polynucleobacter sphagniphilus]MDH6154229.1 sulfate adenylyltransferase subunit 1 [Polynucleobacter sphagniphilus]MDH6248201.1 sulfate adenylyltransferase subunit 1 [Polynucleobacter sphagniphilus]MDH6302195.1 sulfate adenylyltransferase subunit 1 [Polynucleobacter sphagniphilus]MDH6420719.1 sulfate adenylyltransferase subunit 1 [Polynucleobacter sphagniphilus]
MTQNINPTAQQNVVRFITAGSVDDGKSTLIGRLLYDTKSILVDQLESLSKTKHARVTSSDAGVDLALLTDGLEAEREQGITIDVAYRYFSTPKRKFIVADAPGHVQYTRNLVTGASQSDVAVILVDATRVDLNTKPATLLAQTKRHAAIVHLLGLRHVVFAVNKMDLFQFDETVFNSIKEAIEDLTEKIGLPQPTLIPVSALLGANVVTASKDTPWYKGPTLLEWLEVLDTSPQSEKTALRFPVQYVARQDGSASDDFRGYLGQIESGSILKGQKIKVLPGNLEATVSEIYLGNRSDRNQAHSNNAVESAQTGEAVAICLSEDIDVSRGCLFVSADDVTPPTLSKQLSADLCWLDSEPLSLSRKYALRHTTNTVGAKVKGIQRVLDVETLSHASDIHALNTNEIGRVDFILQKPIVADLFEQSQHTGAFILIDETSNHTVAAGMIREVTAQ